MKLMELNDKSFDFFTKEYQIKNFYQTSSYGALMSKHGFFPMYLGLIDDNKIIAATLLLVSSYKGLINKINYAYSPSGFLIDYNNYDLLKTFTTLIKNYLKNKGFIFLKIDPPIIYQKRDNKGNIIENNIDNKWIIDNLKSIGFNHLGFNTYFESLKPRWNMVIKVTSSADRLFLKFDKENKTKIKRALNIGVNTYKGNSTDIEYFYKFIEKKQLRSLDYYKDLYKIFHDNNMCELFIAKIETSTFVKYAKEMYETELINNSNINNKLQININNNQHKVILDSKMSSDKLLAIYKKDLDTANKLIEEYPNGVVIGGALIITYGNEIIFLIDGFDNKFNNFNSNNLLKWKIMEEYIKKGYININLNGITGDFNKDNKYYGLYDFKSKFASEIVEYIGEFDLIINQTSYAMYAKGISLKPMPEIKK